LGHKNLNGLAVVYMIWAISDMPPGLTMSGLQTVLYSRNPYTRTCFTHGNISIRLSHRCIHIHSLNNIHLIVAKPRGSCEAQDCAASSITTRLHLRTSHCNLSKCLSRFEWFCMCLLARVSNINARQASTHLGNQVIWRLTGARRDFALLAPGQECINMI
jgi:hypothetical protein